MKNYLKKIIPLPILIYLLAWKNYWVGESEFRFLKTLIDPTKAAIDVGAHRGLYTYFLSRLVPKVYAYEPNPELIKFLQATVRSNVEIRNIALSDRDGEADLVIPIVNGKQDDGLASLNKKFQSARVQKVKVLLSRLDSQNHEKIGFIKIDVEGHEEKVLIGSRDILTTQKPVLLVEIEQRHIGSRSVTDIFKILKNLGYTGYFLRNGSLVPLSEFCVTRDQLDQLSEDWQHVVGKNYVNNFIFIAGDVAPCVIPPVSSQLPNSR